MQTAVNLTSIRDIIVKDALQDVRREIAVMKKIRHPNLIQLIEVIDNPNSDKLFMVLEFAPGGQLIEWDDDEQVFFKCNDNIEITEQLLNSLFRDCIKGLHYRKLTPISSSCKRDCA